MSTENATIAVQPCAMVLLVGADWRVEAHSAAATGFGRACDSGPLLGRPLAELIPGRELHALRNQMARLSRDGSHIEEYGVAFGGGGPLDLRATRVGERYLIEAEAAAEPRLPDPIGLVRALMDRVDGDDVAALAERGTRQLRALTGFDAVALEPPGGAALVVEDWSAPPRPLAGHCPADVADKIQFRAPGAHPADTLAAILVPLCLDGVGVARLAARAAKPRRCGAERRAVAALFGELLVARMARRGWHPSG